MYVEKFSMSKTIEMERYGYTVHVKIPVIENFWPFWNSISSRTTEGIFLQGSAGAQKNRAPADYLTQDVPLMVQEEIELQVYSLIEIYFANIKCKKLWFSLILSFVVFEYSELYHIKKIYFYIHSKNFMKNIENREKSKHSLYGTTFV